MKPESEVNFEAAKEILIAALENTSAATGDEHDAKSTSELADLAIKTVNQFRDAFRDSQHACE